LERRTARSGRDSIDHGTNAHDDLINVVAGAAWLWRVEQKPMTFAMPYVFVNENAVARTPAEDHTPYWGW
jgi:hypothetical protein